ncbi:DEAD/DEAH box helicase family protein [Maribacter aestuarii]|uniref:DEAD/DEAH box helicase family protein n=1 Tax=Maribacter aestuarii TaxID=1130723 RepID=UPI00248C06F9|nr:DEAD/DEAH box helicase family protein [Maribacter aestuarii]
MALFGTPLTFKFPWREYQGKFLDGFQDHIIDNHLHVVAPPGSGKTILGLEMLLRIGKPTLVLAPTLTIRNQWKARLVDFFEPTPHKETLSISIKIPKLITFSTYQSLFALQKSFGENASQQLVEFIVAHNIETLVLDEAHHLKNEWWNCLFELKAIKNLTIVSLTATPPYDSSALEISRYFELCGPIDDEIAVPDLIKNGDLCPHQDFIYFSRPDNAQIKYIVKYREQIIDFMQSLSANTAFQAFLKGLDIYASIETSLELIYENPQFFSSILIYLKAAGNEIEPDKLKILGFKTKDINFPSFTYEWSQCLLQEILVKQRENFAEQEAILMPIEKELRSIGVLERQKVDFIGNQHLYRNLANSPSKLKSIYEILKDTLEDLKSETRAVVLTDYIRKEFLDFHGSDLTKLNKLGVISIFHYLMAQDRFERRIGVLTGSLVILNSSALEALSLLIPGSNFKMQELNFLDDFYFIKVPESGKNKIVAAVTRLFENGTINVLIGTKALLGEGWDAPSINNLVLASYVGSFVSSNQMRGRAIRVDADIADKTGAIWHLACLDPTAEDGGKDMEKLKQRFKAFNGVSLRNEPFIENGITRLGLPETLNADLDIVALNGKMLQEAKNRSGLKERWHTAIDQGNLLIRSLKVPYEKEIPYDKTKRLAGLNAVKYLSVQIIVGVSFFLPEFLAKNLGTILNKGWLSFMYLLASALILGFGPKTIKALKVYFLFGNQFKKTKKIANAVLAHLISQNLFTKASKEIKIISEQRSTGTFMIYLEGANQHNGNLFVGILNEIIAPIENPRYLLVNQSWLKRKLGFRNYYVVPGQFARRKEDALVFKKYWNTHVDGSKILFTRNIEGRKQLLKARFAHMRYQFEEVPEETITWK